MSAITIDHVSRQFPREPRPAVDDISLEIPSGQFTVLLGPSGCGKTTLLKMVNRLYEPTSGRILMDGTNAADIPATELRRKIGYVIQQTGLFPHMTIAENIAVVPKLLGWDRAKIEPRINELLALVSLPDNFRNRYPRQLSGGQQQRVGVARALAADPAVVLMDEPFGAIDAITRDRLQGELLRIQRQVRKTIMFVTHDVEEALRLADKIVILRTGKVVQYDTPVHIMANPADDFVRELVGTDDVMRRLSLVTVRERMAAPTAVAHGAPLRPDDDLRLALGRLLRDGADALPVYDHDAPVGSIGMAEVRAALRA